MKPDLIDRYFAQCGQRPRDHLASLAWSLARSHYRRRHPGAAPELAERWANAHAPRFLGRAADVVLVVARARARRGEL